MKSILGQVSVYSAELWGLVWPTFVAIKPWPKSLRDTAFCYYIITVISDIKGLQLKCIGSPTACSCKQPTRTSNHKKLSDYTYYKRAYYFTFENLLCSIKYRYLRFVYLTNFEFRNCFTSLSLNKMMRLLRSKDLLSGPIEYIFLKPVYSCLDNTLLKTVFEISYAIINTVFNREDSVCYRIRYLAIINQFKIFKINQTTNRI